jgi:hypothetical protein
MRDLPVNQVYVSDSGKLFIIEDCVRCGDQHQHGAKDGVVAAGDRATRSGHCDLQAGEYYIELADDAEPPQAWRRWMAKQDIGRITTGDLPTWFCEWLLNQDPESVPFREDVDDEELAALYEQASAALEDER